MAGKMIGVEIGNDTVKLVVTNGNAVQSMAVKHMPENMVLDGKVASPDAMANFIKEMRKEFRIPGGSAALVLPKGAVITNSMELPPMSEQELALNLPFEFRDYVGQDGSKFFYDYAVMDAIKGKNGEVEKLDVFAAAVRKDMIDGNYNMLKKAGLTMKVAVPQEMAWLNLVRTATKEPKEICIVDIGHISTHVFIFADGKFLMGREIDIGGKLLDESVAAQSKVDVHLARSYKEANMNEVLTSDSCLEVYNQLAVEVMRAVNFYNSYGTQNGNLQDLYFCGGLSNIEPLRTALKKTADLTLHHVCRLVPGSTESADTLSCALAAGAALQ